MINWKKHPEYIEFLKSYAPNNFNEKIIEEFYKKFGILLTIDQLRSLKKRNRIKSGIRYTLFQKGYMPKNTRAIGSEKVNDKGFIKIKTAEPNKWELKHRVIWKEHYGEIPKNNVIIFLDGNKKNTNIENLAMLTKAERMKLNVDGLNQYQDMESKKARINLAKLELATNKAKKKK